MRQFVLTAVGEDRPGIVADLTKVLYEEGFNIEDSAMTRLNNEFAVMLIVTTEKDITEEELKKSFTEVAKRRNLLINIREIPEEIYAGKKEVGDIYNIVVYGADKPGIVYKVAKLLADKNINIADLRTEKTPELYVLISQVEFPAGLKEDDILGDIEKLKEELNIDISIEKVESVEM
ncbi:glycine cleavage system transcriptional repressor [Persephonella hydrogeniphila]|uniref:Glycine cleavage system transcriptional repressor n=1 Tax=Persephonella hydrogeniphila TaxID=198703 RepID=A0A285NJR8_9AQUI|nr:ACT domain-containing protein [Persephonella hydrogeniphila]SNZ09719.1 glycine cleavage system transcriptional repressor [Persephonella hydrogeniphila]